MTPLVVLAWRRALSALLLLSCMAWPGAAARAADDFLPPEQAFVLQAELRDAGAVLLRWRIAPGYHLYRDRLAFTADFNANAGPGLGKPALPAGTRKFDENFNKVMETYHGDLALTLPLALAGSRRPFQLTIAYQGCADAGLCYPPAAQTFYVDPARPGVLKALPDGAVQAAGAATPVNAGPSGAPATSGPSAAGPAPSQAQDTAGDDQTSLAQRTLQSGSLPRIGAAFLVFGVLLSFTPCVLPMVPILSSIIVGQSGGAPVTRRRGLSLAAAYSVGMALVYTAMGVAAGLAGEGLAGALQKPAVLLGFGALLVALALSMFDVYQLQLPGALQSRLSASSGKLRGGRYAGVFLMGALSAMIVGPCVAAPLAGALLYISQTGNAWTGGWALFAMAAGMSVPLLLAGVSAGTLLPRAGAWMNGVKKVFGLLLLAVAVWMVSPVLPAAAVMALWGALLLLCAVFLRIGEALPAGAGNGPRAARALGMLFLLGGLFELAGAASGGRDVLQPLAHWRGALAVADAAHGQGDDDAEAGAGAAVGASGGSVAGSGSGAGTAAGTGMERGVAGGAGNGLARSGAHAGLRFTRVRTVAELDAILAATREPVMLDFYADWCVACKEMERMTFSEASVGAALRGVRLLQADVTANSGDDRALMKRFQLFGPPGIILFDANGREVPRARVIGFMAPEPFVRQVRLAREAAEG